LRGQGNNGEWDYRADHERWIAAGYFPAVTPDPSYPSGTDLGGALWMSGESTVGNQQHGLPAPEHAICVERPCAVPLSIADHFVFGVGPDVKTSIETHGGSVEEPIRRPGKPRPSDPDRVRLRSRAIAAACCSTWAMTPRRAARRSFRANRMATPSRS
jgi:hypothetical protein